MHVKIEGHRVDVLDKLCAKRSCFWLGFDKGTFVQGRGYTSYHKIARAVCWTRHLHGCPVAWACDDADCCTVNVKLVTYCRRCGKPAPVEPEQQEETKP